MSTGDRITILVAAGAVSATLGMGSCSTNARIGDAITLVNQRIDDVYRIFDDVNRRFDDMNRRFDDVNRRFDDVNTRIDDLQRDVREVRALIVATGREEPVD